METRIFKIDPKNIDKKSIFECAEILKQGGTVAFPTETVYGLGANALDKNAVLKIFQAKGRPADNPLILHVHALSELDKYAESVPESVGMLARFFWPGPLSIILEKKNMIPDIATGGLTTVAFRIPSNEIALKLIETAGIPIAAPSANLSGKPSTTDGSHVIEDLSGRVDAIIDAGRSRIGVESTVLDLTVSPPEILRPGGISFRELKMVIPDIKRAYSIDSGSTPRSPGMKYRHYSPDSPLTIIKGSDTRVIKKINDMMSENPGSGILCSDETINRYKSSNRISAGSRNNPSEIASNIFHALRLFDKSGVTGIYCEYFGIGDLEEAVMNRLIKASINIIDLG